LPKKRLVKKITCPILGLRLTVFNPVFEAQIGRLMQLHKILIALFLMITGPFVLADEGGSISLEKSEAVGHHHEGDHGEGHHEGGHHGLSPNAVELTKIGPLPITNSMVVTWVVALGIIIVVQMATRNVALIPEGLQNFVELLIEGLFEFFRSVVGDHMIHRTFWFLATAFIFILFANWFGLIPGLGTIGWAEPGHHNEHITEPLMRGVNADLNMTLGMAAIFMCLWLYWSLTEQGLGGFVGHIFAVKGHGGGLLGTFLVVVFIFVGMIEVVSIGVRPVALTFRLYGNVFAGENILETVMAMGGLYFGWLAVLPFYLLEILVGLVQALVFALLCAVFTALMCEKHEEHAH